MSIVSLKSKQFRSIAQKCPQFLFKINLQGCRVLKYLTPVKSELLGASGVQQSNETKESNVDFASRLSRKTLLCGATILSAMLMPSMLTAEQVTLKSADGTVNLVGEFIEFKDDNYIIRTDLGDLRISAARVRCEGAACPSFDVAAADVEIAGSDTLALGMMPLLISGFAAAIDAEAELRNTGVPGQTLASIVGDSGYGDELGTYLVTSTSTEDAFDALMNGEAKIGLASRRIQPSEARELKADGAGNMIRPNQERVVAVDSLVVITHPSNPVGEIAIEDLRKIYSGEISNWSELGGPDLEINIVGINEGDTTREFFDNRVLGDGATSIVSTVVADDQEMAAAVNGDPGAVGYVGYAFQRGAKALTLVNECGIPTVPDAFSAKTEEYPLGRRMYLYNRADRIDDAAQSFLDYAISAEADGVVAKSGFIDLGIARRPQTMDGGRANMLLSSGSDAFEAGVMREMVSEMVDYDRLSTTFRFRTGSSRMDEKAQLDMRRLINFLEDMPEGTQVKFVGFTDDDGAFEANRALSETRAAEVMEQIQEAAEDRLAQIDFETLGFGEIAPSACNVTNEGKAINRRVEVWINQSAG